MAGKPKKQRISKRDKKVEEMYKANPTWAEEDNYVPPSVKQTQIRSDNTLKINKEKLNDTANELMAMKRGGTKKVKYKTGGMVNTNTKVKALLSAGSKGVKSGVNSKVSASKSAKGPGKRSTAPKAAVPKAKRGMIMRKK